ncbi:MAG: VPLPA-CTERM-specific exosortase XrtD [Deltaproteobacteria bacterium]|nr:VPLPA-CTERM-specific exosortase XrtD [Deltaproteobacteria bacterium]
MNPLLTIRTDSWVKFSVYLFLMSALYLSAFKGLVIEDWVNDYLNYAYLIPFVVLYLFWIKRSDLTSIAAKPSWKGFLPVIFGMVLFWLGEIGGIYFFLYISFWLVLVGLCWIHLGRQKLKVIAFPLFFILTMFPIPSFLYVKITLELRLISSKLGVMLIELFGLPVFREGNIIDLGFVKLQVVEACSGLNSLISIMVLSLLLVYFYKVCFWKRAVLFFSSIPLVIFANSFRIAFTAFLYDWVGAKAANEFFHGFSGLVIYVFCLLILLGEMWLLNKLPPYGPLPEANPSKSNLESPLNYSQQKTNENRRKYHAMDPGFIVAVILLAAILALSQGIDFRERIPLRRDLIQFPLEINEWSGARKSMENEFIQKLNFSDYLIVDYKNILGQEVNFYVAYYESQRKNEAIHSPAACLPKSGWGFKEAGAVRIPISPDSEKTIRVHRALIQKDRDIQIAYYWFAQRGRILTTTNQVRIFNFLDAFAMQRTDGALVRFITPVYRSEQINDADARLKLIVGDLVPVLDEFIPGMEI